MSFSKVNSHQSVNFLPRAEPESQLLYLQNPASDLYPGIDESSLRFSPHILKIKTAVTFLVPQFLNTNCEMDALK
jgi:hypothetical protein